MLNTIVLGLVATSFLTCLLLSREFVKTAMKREELLQAFTYDISSTKCSRGLLIGIYVTITLLVTIGLSNLLLSIAYA